MGMTLKVECSMCGSPRKPPLELDIQGPKDLEPDTIEKRITLEGWIVQVNGASMDTYCSKRCAE